MDIQPKVAAPYLAIRVARIDGNRLGELNEQGFAMLEKLLSHKECRAIASLYPDDSFAAASSWTGTASGRVSTNISSILSPA